MSNTSIDTSVLGALTGIEALKERFPWPLEPPTVAPRDHGWFPHPRRPAIRNLTNPKAEVYLELGTWLGKSAKWFAEQCLNATILCVDHWNGSREHHRDPDFSAMLPTLYETFLRNMWQYRDRVIPVRMDTCEAMRLISSLGINVDMLYVDAAHDAASVHQDVVTALELFPKATILGDDWKFKGVRAGVATALDELNMDYRLRNDGFLWWLES